MNKLLPLILFSFSIPLVQLNAQIQLTDFIYQEGDKGSGPSNFVTFNDLIFFEAVTQSEGSELWVSDGTDRGTRLLKDIHPGNSSGIITSFKQSAVVLADELFFIADDGEYGRQIWATQGTEQSTRRVTNLLNLNISKLTLVGDVIFFLVKENNLLHVWKTDGTREGTVLVKGNLPVWNSPTFEGAANNLFFFTFQPPDTNNSRVWRSDGTASGTFPVTVEVDGNGAGGGTSALTQYIVFNNELYFVIRSYTIFSYAASVGIMKTDGTIENTVPIKAVHEGSIRLIDYADVIEINNKLYFSFFEAEYNRLFIWESDGTESGTQLIYDQYGGNYFLPSNLSTDGKDLIFTGKSMNSETALLRLKLDTYEIEEIKELLTNIRKPYTFFGDVNQINKLSDHTFHISVAVLHYEKQGWISDLTTANTIPIEELKYVKEILVHDDFVYFSGNTEQQGYELWKSDIGFSNPAQLSNINQFHHGMGFLMFTVLDDKIFFGADDNIHGYELWVYNNTTKDIYLVKDIYSGEKPAGLSVPVRFNDHVYFKAFTEGSGYELWRSDGTEEGTVMVADLKEGANSSSPGFITVMQGKVFFLAHLTDNFFLCATDGVNIEVIKELGANLYSSANKTETLVSTGNRIFFSAIGAGHDLWVSDGTESGTFKVKDFYTIDHLTAVNDKVFFTATDPNHREVELWQSDGTVAGTTMVKDIGEGYASKPDNLFNYNGQLIFTAYTREYGKEFWKTDGTAQGTQQITDINPGSDGSATTTNYAIYNGLLYFGANDGAHGTELWKTDGTAEGTMLVSDINEGEEGSFPKYLISNDKKLYFSAYTAESGQEVWSTEGTASTTSQLFDIINGFQGSVPSDFMFIGDELFFVAETITTGRQLWHYVDGAVTGTDAINKSEMFSIYPNPTSDYLYFKNGHYKSLKVLDLSGQRVTVGQNLADRLYVGSLTPGIYLLVAELDGKIIVKKFIRE